MSRSILLTGGRLPGSDAPVDVRVIDGVIDAIVPSGDSPGDLAAGVPSLDLDGRWIVPGLWDNHVHFSQWAAVSRRLDVGGAGSAAETVAIVARAVAASGAGVTTAGEGSTGTGGPTGSTAAELLVGYGFRDGLWSDEPTAAALDAVSGIRPVVLVSGDLHCCWLNTAALAQFGLAGHPTGLLREDEAFAVHRALDDAPAETVDAWAREAAQAAAARGVVGIVDLEMAWNREVWERRLDAGHDLLRVDFGVYPQHLERAIGERMRTGDAIGRPVDGESLVRVGPAKIITDGSLNTRTAYCFDEYPGLAGSPTAHGLLTIAPEDLAALLARATGAGFVPAVHAIGDHANRLVLDAFEAAGCGGALEHAQLVAESDFARFAPLGVTASVQPEHAMDDRDVADRYWAGRTGRSFALASLLEAGATLALGSDAPVAPLDPWITMAAAVGRARDGREPWHPEQRIPVQAALAASARGRRRIEVGAPADVAVAELDPHAATPAALRATPVALTLLAGRPTHSTL
ncbi:amidohydrolase [Herbiconiux sp. YIM B11900]|uniref:amidohydrolase n=1 Tax=Herbiconiux sp. YIM B11900 TaxID=3404131 RepID=UPI003F8449AD